MPASIIEKQKLSDRFFKRTKPKPLKEHYGRSVETKTFYEHYDKDKNEWHWVEWAQPSLPEAKRLKFEGAAVQVYKIPEKDKEETKTYANTRKYKIYSIRLQSPLLINALRSKLEEYGVDVNETRAKIYAPCAVLFFERNHIAKLAQTHEDAVTREHLELLCKVLNEELGSILDESEALIEQGKITSDLVWTLFPPNSLVISKREGNSVDWGGRIACKGKYIIDMNIPWECLEFDGFEFGFVQYTSKIDPYKGKKNIKDLPIYPLWAAQDADKLKDRFVKRGKKRLEYQAFHFVSGTLLKDANATIQANPGEENQGMSQRKVVIDSYLYAKERGRRVKIEPISRRLQQDDLAPVNGGNIDDDYDYNLDGEIRPELGSTARISEKDQQHNKELVLQSEDNPFIMAPTLDGFSLTRKLWGTYEIESVRNVETNSVAYDHLVLPPNTKTLINTLVENYIAFPSVGADVIADKGQGLLVLLSGEPGTGKTLLAEAIADKTNSPLYSIDAKELGTSSYRMSDTLDDIMARAAEWKSIILLNEADVYLADRGPSSLHNNSIVSVFLQQLETHKGILFLTTNLFETLDRAIESRIQVHLTFPALQADSRTQIWSKFAARIPKEAHLSEADLRELGLWNLNGRQIKNVLKMTLLAAQTAKGYITLTDLEEMISMTCPKAEKKGEEKLTNGDSIQSGEENLVDL